MKKNFSFPDFSKTSVLVVGDVMLDRYLDGCISRISPEAPVPVVHVTQQEDRLGGAANTALNLASLGVDTKLLGVVGLDEAGDSVEKLLDLGGVRSNLQRVKGVRTIIKLRILSLHQQLLRVDFEDPLPPFNADLLRIELAKMLDGVNTVVFSDYAKGTLAGISNLIADCLTLDKIVVVDPKGADFELYRGATIITPNYSEFTAVVGECKSDEEIESKGRDLISKYDFESVLVTRGEEGMTLISPHDNLLHLRTSAQQVYDITGAGDTVVAVMSASLASGLPLNQAVRLGNIAAGIVVGKVGTSVVNATEMKVSVDKENDTLTTVLCGTDNAFEQVQMSRARGEKIVMTNGCFDILHPGHVDYLNKAKALGDRLFVGLNDDASVRKLKGYGRPINDSIVRRAMLTALECVDWVVSFPEDTPVNLISKVIPDILVKGGDYTPEQIAGAEVVQESGGEVVIIDFLEGHSTSALIERIRG